MEIPAARSSPLIHCHLFHLQLISRRASLLGLPPRPSPQLLLGLRSTQIRRQDLRDFCHSTGFSSFYPPVTLRKRMAEYSV